MLDFSSISNRTLIGKIVRFPLRFIPREVTLPVLQGPLRGARWIAGSASHGCWLGSYEKRKQLAFAEALNRGDVVYDIGANVGFYSLLASRLVGGEGIVYSFEPVQRNVKLLRRHIALNDISNVIVFEVAVAETKGRASFEATDSYCQGHLSDRGACEVDTESLDGLSASIRAPACIKIDVEGAEASVLRGARALLARSRPVIFLATHGSSVHRECISLLEDLSYQIDGLGGEALNNTDELIATPSLTTVESLRTNGHSFE